MIYSLNITTPKCFDTFRVIFRDCTLIIYIYIYTYTYITGCPRRNVPDFGRMFLMLKYTDITQNTYIQI